MTMGVDSVRAVNVVMLKGSFTDVPDIGALTRPTNSLGLSCRRNIH